MHSRGENTEGRDPLWLKAARKRKELGRSFGREGTRGGEKQCGTAAWNTNARAVEGMPGLWRECHGTH